ncbi:MAG: M48 family metallopeptidase [Acidobacteriia bacterium]|nr:M48 family metallopeptidase [Terriglobia bacterium]
MKRHWAKKATVVVLVFLMSVPSALLFGQNKNEKDVNDIGNRNVGKGLNRYSIEKEIALGKSMAQEVERTSKLVDDPVITEYVNRVGQNLVKHSDAQVPFTIKVIDGDEVNAFALPGGFFFVYTGLVLAAQNESELAGVMAHEIAHVAARHGTRQATRAEVANWASLPLIFLGGWAGYGIRQAASLALPLGFLKFSRGFEEEADYLGLQYMYAAGYDPNGLVTFFERIQAQDKHHPGFVGKAFSTHPQTPERVERAKKEIEQLLPQKDAYIVTTSDFDMAKGRLTGIENRRTVEEARSDRPTLKRRTSGDTTDVDNNSDTKKSGDDAPPTLKRRN